MVADTQGFLRAAADTIGAAHVIADPAGLAPFARVMMPVDPTEHAPAGVVSPADVGQVQALLALASAMGSRCGRRPPAATSATAAAPVRRRGRWCWTCGG